MIPYALEAGDISSENMLLFRRVCEIIDLLPNGITCHEVCAEITQKIPELKHVRGYFQRRGLDHSWLLLSGTFILIDPYPWCSAVPMIVTTDGVFNPWKQLYMEDSQEFPADLWLP